MHAIEVICTIIVAVEIVVVGIYFFRGGSRRPQMPLGG